MFSRFSMRVMCLAAVGAAAAGSVGKAGSIGLAWDASAGASGYRVYYGTNSSSLNNTVDVPGGATQTILNNLSDCTTIYFAVKAYDAAGIESQPTNPVTKVIN